MPATLETLLQRYPGATTFTYGDSAALSARLVALTASGAKTATTGALRDYETGDEVLPCVGRRDIVLGWDGAPVLVIETLEVVTCRFDAVTEEMALAEGENDDRAGWAADHAAYFARNGGYAPDMLVVWERFRVIADLT
ncbi:Uncharacterized protein YhfF [Loktanella fryxellensis]|uniref:Uncharacterized protein YhfF n=1 Tax=Loktanella fryxellensis TaxID=245187 RepID=A0A1H8GEH6_9RHOB|nr:ASCH domain-containing protein [Loktanella fryxellensis]SEN42190.1 Uncharacterized protein YhfF [Loktanella fryxellensis]